MGDTVKGKQDFNAAEFSRRANNLAVLSKIPLEGFVAGTYNGSYSGNRCQHKAFQPATAYCHRHFVGCLIVAMAGRFIARQYALQQRLFMQPLVVQYRRDMNCDDDQQASGQQLMPAGNLNTQIVANQIHQRPFGEDIAVGK